MSKDNYRRPKQDTHYLPEVIHNNIEFYKTMDEHEELCEKFKTLMNEIADLEHPWRSQFNVWWNPFKWWRPSKKFSGFNEKMDELNKRIKKFQNDIFKNNYLLGAHRDNWAFEPKDGLPEELKEEVRQYYSDLILHEIKSANKFVKQVGDSSLLKLTNSKHEEELAISDFQHYQTLYVSFIALFLALLSAFL